MKTQSRWIVAAGFGVELVGLMGLFLYAGRYVDAKYEWPGYGVTVGGLLALVIWLIHVVVTTKALEDKE